MKSRISFSEWRKLTKQLMIVFHQHVTFLLEQKILQVMMMKNE